MKMNELALKMLRSEQLEAQYVGYLNMVKTLIQTGWVIFPKNATKIETHLKKFSFITFQGDLPDGFENIQFSFDQRKFLFSNEFKEHAKGLLNDLKEKVELKEKELEIIRNDIEQIESITEMLNDNTRVKSELSAINISIIEGKL
jgi:hypothetical protein